MGKKPHKYKEDFPDKLIEHMEFGLSFESFAAKCSVSVQSLYDWVGKYDEFAKAKAIGEAKSLLWWEQAMRSGMMGQIKGFLPVVGIFTMKCRFRKFGYQDEPQDSAPKDQTNEAKNLLVLLRQTVQDTQCQQISHTVSPSPLSKSLSQSGLLMASREINSMKSPEEPQILKSDTTE